MLGSILVGLDTPRHADALVELGIRWAKPTGATLVGLGIVDEPGIRAIEPAFPVGGTPGVDPVIHRGYEARMADVRHKAEQVLEGFAARCAGAGVNHQEVTAVGPPHEMIEGEAQAADLVVLSRGAQFRFTAKGD
jgi:nucleotide-binding universal stress UspA family protein